ncbi:uncharacterized protein MONOS_3052 [Monocercomonoides exilis]|uniref:uncharacterized protein n=1 Tax=Monocercomonoides exilis TaxID=2049356 RepID=UPI00355A2A6A|nr:hypothetical protein MONOS_3052 [Monocercomonoides exilis]|eukprot:MONOS_3052.1-p1 / transcript=MONOS_3052.1 / gene=MONOS_3052 / organism=Monocercomonoides_exilis_PA203 / gene_product=unspecified product / transcript_product=unspecified product / location=Mono_scaffold00068:37251-37691(-) / protein_length=147 / sequence_SO=supercontig / SO=protein_coding / is_pseudo=false
MNCGLTTPTKRLWNIHTAENVTNNNWLPIVAQKVIVANSSSGKDACDIPQKTQMNQMPNDDITKEEEEKEEEEEEEHEEDNDQEGKNTYNFICRGVTYENNDSLDEGDEEEEEVLIEISYVEYIITENIPNITTSFSAPADNALTT